MGKASEAILALKPVTFRYKRKLDPDGIPQFGLVAEQVEKVNPDLVARDRRGKVITVRYEAVNAMLLNAPQGAGVGSGDRAAAEGN
jgi:Chaperone of endosialidase